MKDRSFHFWVAVLFTLIAVLHAWRVIAGWEVMIGGVLLPLWVSAVVVIVVALLAHQSYKRAKK